MSAGADAGIVLPAPIEEVVARFRSRPRMVGDLVGRKPCRLAKLLGEQVERARQIAIRNVQHAGIMARGEWRALLDGELIERKVVCGEAERVPKLLGPGLSRLPFARIDQVERDPVEMALGKRERRKRLKRGVLAPKGFQARIIERLHAERQPVASYGPVAREALRLDTGRIGLERDLGVAL